MDGGERMEVDLELGRVLAIWEEEDFEIDFSEGFLFW